MLNKILIDDLLKRLKRLRFEKELTQAEVSQKLGFTSPAAYLKIESGQTEIKLSQLLKLAEVFEVSVNYLLGFSEERHDKRELNWKLDKMEAKMMKIKIKTVCLLPKVLI